jgi:hypothetical protein
MVNSRKDFTISLWLPDRAVRTWRVDGYKRPGMDMRVGAILTVAAVWPIAAAIIVGSSIGEVAREGGSGATRAAPT